MVAIKVVSVSRSSVYQGVLSSTQLTCMLDGEYGGAVSVIASSIPSPVLANQWSDSSVWICAWLFGFGSEGMPC